MIDITEIDRDHAREAVGLAVAATASLNHLLWRLQEVQGGDVYVQNKRTVGRVMADIFFQIVDPLVDAYPELQGIDPIFPPRPPERGSAEPTHPSDPTSTKES